MIEIDYASRPLTNRVVVVTGASRGIGRSIATHMSAAGADVVAVSRSGDAPDPLVGRIAPARLDIRDREAPRVLLSIALDTFGHIDGLVNNAGLIHFSPCWKHGDAEWDDLVATNLTAPFRISQAFARHWIGRDEAGAILNLGSIESQVAVERQAGYAATKGGVAGLTRAMALALAPHGIRVNAVAPGAIETEMSGPLKQTTEARIPLERLGTPDEIGSVAVFLLSDLARYVNGAILYTDGGYTTQ